MVTAYDPFQEMDRLVGQMFGSARAAATMPMDLYRSGDHYVLLVDLPGADPGTIDVSVEDRTLTIHAQRTPRTETDVQWLARERPSGTYARQLTVSRGLDLQDITATYADGVLALTIPVAESSKPRRVEVQRGVREAHPTIETSSSGSSSSGSSLGSDEPEPVAGVSTSTGSHYPSSTESYPSSSETPGSGGVQGSGPSTE
ncbi:Hsp20/alpha crystallin family protein [Cellulomonas chengniuliangii]|uniref:Hsp20/alpha crystallin family protein n=1 Tax=Cellulomonas chengniuliangii TaxID=2968084 RepID=UPI001D0E44E6|nr:Hsp20/alpha crystallin family protein [Cellulomonas chengniuliangii]MCC2318344.1 Hsp20/alpha crystallin family protein [Cellulomonas chengniuliangii]